MNSASPEPDVLWLRNRHPSRRVNTRLLRQIVRWLITEELALTRFELGIQLVPDHQMIFLNETFLHHAGSTDVIAFNHAPTHQPDWVHGEVFVCLDEAERNGRRYRASWSTEMVRYIIHGILHLQGHDDQRPAKRRLMKREENRLLKRLGRQFCYARLEA